MIKAIIFDFFGVVRIDSFFGAKINDELLDYISSLKPCYKIGLISNSSGETLKKTLSRQQQTLYDMTIFSADEGLAKPETGIFELAAKKLELSPAECVFIDDSAQHCEGARAAGMQAIIYKDFSQMKSELENLLSADLNN